MSSCLLAFGGFADHLTLILELEMFHYPQLRLSQKQDWQAFIYIFFLGGNMGHGFVKQAGCCSVYAPRGNAGLE